MRTNVIRWTAAAALMVCLSVSAVLHAAPAKDDWTIHNDPLGFSVEHPGSWAVETTAEATILVRNADEACFVLVQPFLAGPGDSAQSVVERVPQLFSTRLAKAKVAQSRRVSSTPDQVAASLTYEFKSNPAQAGVLCTVNGRFGTLYAMAAPDNRFSAVKKTFLRILRSFKFTQPSDGRPSAPGIKFVRWTDPVEGAFSLEVPQGWSVTGGLTRVAPADTRPAVQVVSPEGDIACRFRDKDIPMFVVPTAMGAQLGYPEGSTMVYGGSPMTVMRYMTGADFATLYVSSRLEDEYPDLALSSPQNRPESAAKLNADFQKLGLNWSMTAGDVRFTCSIGGQAFAGYCFASTVLIPFVGTEGGTWTVLFMHAYVAPARKESLAAAVLTHMVETYREDPEWAKKQGENCARLSQIVSRTHSEISDIIYQSGRKRAAAEDEIARKWSNVTLGLTDVRDPESGETWKVESGRNYYWARPGSDAAGVVGTQSADRPDIDFAPLEEW